MADVTSRLRLVVESQGADKSQAALKGLEDQSKRTVDQAGKLTAAFSQLGAILGTALSAQAIGKTVQAFDESAKAMARVEQAIKSTGGSAGFTAQELAKVAGSLQKITVFDDDQILSDVTGQLLRFGNIAGDQFLKAQQAALDLATVLGGDLQSAAIKVGKLLDDPVHNFEALARAGISFSKTQQDVIKSLVATGNAAKAQTIILDELNKTIGGQAVAAAQVGAGAFQQLKNAMTDVQEVIGKDIVDALAPAASAIKDFLSNEENVRSMATALEAVGAALAISFAPAVIAALGAVAGAFLSISAPVAILAAAVAGLIAFGPGLIKMLTGTNDAGVGLQATLELLGDAAKKVGDGFEKAVPGLSSFETGLDNVVLKVEDFVNNQAQQLLSILGQITGLTAVRDDIASRGAQIEWDRVKSTWKLPTDDIIAFTQAKRDAAVAAANHRAALEYEDKELERQQKRLTELIAAEDKQIAGKRQMLDLLTHGGTSDQEAVLKEELAVQERIKGISEEQAHSYAEQNVALDKQINLLHQIRDAIHVDVGKTLTDDLLGAVSSFKDAFLNDGFGAIDDFGDYLEQTLKRALNAQLWNSLISPLMGQVFGGISGGAGMSGFGGMAAGFGAGGGGGQFIGWSANGAPIYSGGGGGAQGGGNIFSGITTSIANGFQGVSDFIFGNTTEGSFLDSVLGPVSDGLSSVSSALSSLPGSLQSGIGAGLSTALSGGDIGQSLGAAAGAAIGMAVAGPIGAAIGQVAGAALGEWVGGLFEGGAAGDFPSFHSTFSVQGGQLVPSAPQVMDTADPQAAAQFTSAITDVFGQIADALGVTLNNANDFFSAGFTTQYGGFQYPTGYYGINTGQGASGLLSAPGAGDVAGVADAQQAAEQIIVQMFGQLARSNEIEGISDASDAVIEAFAATSGSLEDMTNTVGLLESIINPTDEATSDWAKALKALHDQFDPLIASMEELHQATGKVTDALDQAVAKLREEFVGTIEDSILGFTSPVASQFNTLVGSQSQRNADAAALGLDTAQMALIDQLNTLEIQKFTDGLVAAGNSIDDIIEAFDIMRESASGSADELAHVSQVIDTATAQLTQDFNAQVQGQIDTLINDPLTALEKLLEAQQTRVTDAQKIGADLDAVAKLNALEQQQFFDGLTDDALQQVQDFLDVFGDSATIIGQNLAMSRSDLSNVADQFAQFAQDFSSLTTDLTQKYIAQSPAESLDVLRSRASDLLAGIQSGDASAAKALPDVLNQFVENARNTFGNTQGFQDALNFALDLSNQAQQASLTVQSDAERQIIAIDESNDILSDIRDILQSSEAYNMLLTDSGPLSADELLALIQAGGGMVPANDNTSQSLTLIGLIGQTIEPIVDPLVTSIGAFVERLAPLTSLQQLTIDAIDRGADNVTSRIGDVEDKLDEMKLLQQRQLEELERIGSAQAA